MPIPLLLPNMLFISNNVRILWQTICNILLEKEDRGIGEKENIWLCVSVCRNLLSGFPAASERCRKAAATVCAVKGKQGCSAGPGESCCAVSWCFPLSHVACSVILLFPCLAERSAAVLTLPVLVFVSWVSAAVLLLQDLLNVVCCEKQCRAEKAVWMISAECSHKSYIFSLL